MLRFAGKVAIVTGGASGIGEATVRRLHQEGANVVVADIRPDAIERLLDEIGPDRVMGHQIDMLYSAQIEAMVAATVARFRSSRYSGEQCRDRLAWSGDRD